MRDIIIDIIIKITNYTRLKENLEIDLIKNEILDSLAFIELITELEETFDVEIQPTQIPSDTWRSVEKIVKMVEEKRKK